MSEPIRDGEIVILRHGDPLTYAVFTGIGWAISQIWIARGICHYGPEYPSFIEAKRANDAGTVQWEITSCA